MSEEFLFAERRDFRAWLRQHGAESPGIWLLFGKKGGPVTLSANDALEEALCFGWIDGQMRKIDDTRYRKYFARRTRSSHWSEKNKKLAQQLVDRGSMCESGLRAMEAAKRSGAWSKSGRAVITEKDIEDFAALLSEYGDARTNFLSMSPSVRKSYTGLYLDAKSEETRKARLARIVDRLRKNLKPME